jgi:hypothetical protein
MIQNVIVRTFDPCQFEFTLGWVYVFGVEVPCGTLLRR